MLKEKTLTVTHPLFGVIRINNKFAQVLELPPFRELAFKSQLGNKVFSRTILNAKHTRLNHSIGVMYLTDKLLDCCEKKFSQYFKVTQVDREVLELVALGHDVGHIAFSHSLEDKKMKTHEERTIEIFKKYADKINQIFGYDITSKVISIFENNQEIKKNGVNANDVLDVSLIFKNLLIGTIDCDRMEYLMTDRYMVYGERIDFTNILDYITIVWHNDYPMVGFEKEAMPMIENFLLSRFIQYENIYWEEREYIIEMLLRNYVKEANWSTEFKESITEYEFMSYMKQEIREDNNKKLSRIARIIMEGETKNLLFRRFKDVNQYQYFLERLYSITERRDIITTKELRLVLYNPNNKSVLIKCGDGLVRDITEVSSIIKDYSEDLCFVMVDIDPIYKLDKGEAENIRKLFEDNPVEIEKK